MIELFLLLLIGIASEYYAWGTGNKPLMLVGTVVALLSFIGLFNSDKDKPLSI